MPLWRAEVNVVFNAIAIVCCTYACDFSEAVAPCSQRIFRVDILIR